MASTGEVACFGSTQYEAFLKAMISAGFKLPTRNVLISIGPMAAKLEFLQSATLLHEMGYQLFCTKSTHEYLRSHGGFESSIFLYKPSVKREPNVLSYLQTGKLDLVINVPDSMDSLSVTDGYEIRRNTIDSGVSLVTDIKNAVFMVQALHAKWSREMRGKEFWGCMSWQEHVERVELP
jgi:hypothetical protein